MGDRTTRQQRIGALGLAGGSVRMSTGFRVPRSTHSRPLNDQLARNRKLTCQPDGTRQTREAGMQTQRRCLLLRRRGDQTRCLQDLYITNAAFAKTAAHGGPTYPSPTGREHQRLAMVRRENYSSRKHFHTMLHKVRSAPCPC